MSNYKEIVTKAIVAKGKKNFVETNHIPVENPSTILGCWVINHNFDGRKENDKIIINGSYDVNIWYSYDNDTKTNVVKKQNSYQEVVHMREVDDIEGEEIVVRSLKQPNCIKAELKENEIYYTIEKELGIELVGDIKVKIEANEGEEDWDEIVEDKSESIEDNIEKEVKEDYIKEDSVI